ncbi:MAG: sulfur carrier protein ThiS [Bryobacteraceae bacterium]|jgi:thiamine biosynthesis protein ThiS|nr:sulfur carrier protein ThiS [Bryobacteraceae bacterium]
MEPAQPREIEIVVNGERRRVPEGQTVLEFLRSLNVDPARVAVEMDREILKRERWAQTPLAPGARLEIVQFVGGG